jgi:hypothetical protein
LAAVGAVEGRRFAMRSVSGPLIFLEVGVRWTARVLTALLVLVVLLIFLGEGFSVDEKHRNWLLSFLESFGSGRATPTRLPCSSSLRVLSVPSTP